MENNVEDIMKFCTNNDKDEQRPKSINFKPWNWLFYMIVEFYNKSQNPGWEHWGDERRDDECTMVNIKMMNS